MAKRIAIIIFVGLLLGNYSRVNIVDPAGKALMYGYMDRYIVTNNRIAGMIFIDNLRIEIYIDNKEDWENGPMKLWYGTARYYFAATSELYKEYDCQVLELNNLGSMAYTMQIFNKGELFKAEDPLYSIAFVDETWGDK